MLPRLPIRIEWGCRPRTKSSNHEWTEQAANGEEALTLYILPTAITVNINLCVERDMS
jgi:hypothetical protein